MEDRIIFSSKNLNIINFKQLEGYKLPIYIRAVMAF
jgi:hypothetical protein